MSANITHNIIFMGVVVLIAVAVFVAVQTYNTSKAKDLKTKLCHLLYNARNSSKDLILWVRENVQ